MRDLISVIVPVYQVERWMEQCVESVLNQTYENLEIILVDDGSYDGCPGLCDAYRKKDVRVRVIHKSNGGLSSARNAGLEAAAGKYIVFVDSDDYIHSEMIAKLYEEIEDSQADLAMCDLAYVDEEGARLREYPVNIGLRGSFDQYGIYEKMYGSSWIYCVAAWNKMYHRKLWADYRYPEGKLHEDEFAIHHILGQCNKIVCTDKKYYYYRQREGSITGEKNLKRLLDVTEAHLERQEYFKSNVMTDYMVRNDHRCFRYLRDVYDDHPYGRDFERYLLYREKYYQLHGWVIQQIKYPVFLHMQVKLYSYFPGVVNELVRCYEKIKTISAKKRMQ